MPKIAQIAARQIFPLQRYCIEIICYFLGDFVTLYKVFHGLGMFLCTWQESLEVNDFLFSLRSH